MHPPIFSHCVNLSVIVLDRHIFLRSYTQKNTSVQNNHLQFHTMTLKMMVRSYYCLNRGYPCFAHLCKSYLSLFVVGYMSDEQSFQNVLVILWTVSCVGIELIWWNQNLLQCPRMYEVDYFYSSHPGQCKYTTPLHFVNVQSQSDKCISLHTVLCDFPM